MYKKKTKVVPYAQEFSNKIFKNDFVFCNNSVKIGVH